MSYLKLLKVTMAVTKIDDELVKKIEKLIKEGDNRFDFPSVKSFVDKAVNSYLKEKIK